MFESQESPPWYRSITGLIATSLLLPPVGLALLWMRREMSTRTKLLGSFGIVLLGAGYLFLFNVWSKSGANEAHYAALEQNRAQQQREAITPSAANNPAQPTASATASPGQQSAVIGQQTVVPGAGSSTETAAAHALRNYWTNFRGPNRDGRYDETQVLTKWPTQGLSLIWKEPVGLGYASITIA